MHATELSWDLNEKIPLTPLKRGEPHFRILKTDRLLSVVQISGYAYLILISFYFIYFLEEARVRNILYQEFQGLLETISEDEVVILEGYPAHYFYLDYSLNTKAPFFCLGWISLSLNKVEISSLKEADHYSLFGFLDKKDSLYLPECMNSIGRPLN